MVQIYPWFKLYFPLSLGMVMNDNLFSCVYNWTTTYINNPIIVSDDCYSSPQQVIYTWIKITTLVNFTARVAGGIVMPGVLSCCHVEAPGRSLEGKSQPSLSRLRRQKTTTLDSYVDQWISYHVVCQGMKNFLLSLLFFFFCSFLVSLESFSNDDGDGNEDVKKAMGLLRKTTTLHVHYAFFVHFFTVLARLRRENA